VTRLHPFTLLALAAGLAALAWLLPAPVGGAAMAATALGLAAAAGPRRALLPALLTAAPFWLFLLILHDIGTTVAIGLRLTTMTASFVWLVATLPPPRLVEAMVAAGWSASTAYVFAATLSAVPGFRARAQRIIEAQRCRGLSPRGGVGHRLRALQAVALPLILSALHEVDERALALETRGLAPGIRRTPLHPPVDRRTERLARWGIVVLCAAAGVWRAA
jgi:energy-coupling factor transporter transmembrane protein EcfT